MHKEKWVSPYNGGAELAGCGGGEGNFAKKAVLELGRLQVVATVSCTACSAYQSSLLWYVANGMCAAQKVCEGWVYEAHLTDLYLFSLGKRMCPTPMQEQKAWV